MRVTQSAVNPRFGVRPNVRRMGEFPQKNGWSRITPSVVWYGDPASSVMIEFDVVGRNDVARVEVTNGFSENNKIVLYDDATHGDATASDNIFTASGVQLPCPAFT